MKPWNFCILNISRSRRRWKDWKFESTSSWIKKKKIPFFPFQSLQIHVPMIKFQCLRNYNKTSYWFKSIINSILKPVKNQWIVTKGKAVLYNVRSRKRWRTQSQIKPTNACSCWWLPPAPTHQGLREPKWLLPSSSIGAGRFRSR